MDSEGGFGGLGIGNPGSYGGAQSVGAPGFEGGYGSSNDGLDEGGYGNGVVVLDEIVVTASRIEVNSNTGGGGGYGNVDVGKVTVDSLAGIGDELIGQYSGTRNLMCLGNPLMDWATSWQDPFLQYIFHSSINYLGESYFGSTYSTDNLAYLNGKRAAIGGSLLLGGKGLLKPSLWRTGISKTFVFWEGGKYAKQEAIKWAAKNNGIVMAKTTSGRLLDIFGRYLPIKSRGYLIESFSERFAGKVSGTTRVFIYKPRMSNMSIWRSVERKGLLKRGIRWHSQYVVKP